jgi:hypothetical protein
MLLLIGSVTPTAAQTGPVLRGDYGCDAATAGTPGGVLLAYADVLQLTSAQRTEVAAVDDRMQQVTTQLRLQLRQREQLRWRPQTPNPRGAGAVRCLGADRLVMQVLTPRR